MAMKLPIFRKKVKKTEPVTVPVKTVPSQPSPQREKTKVVASNHPTKTVSNTKKNTSTATFSKAAYYNSKKMDSVYQHKMMLELKYWEEISRKVEAESRKLDREKRSQVSQEPRIIPIIF